MSRWRKRHGMLLIVRLNLWYWRAITQDTGYRQFQFSNTPLSLKLEADILPVIDCRGKKLDYSLLASKKIETSHRLGCRKLNLTNDPFVERKEKVKR